MFRNVSRGNGIALAPMGLGLIAILAVGCGGGESKSVETSAPAAAGVAGLDPMSRLEALVREEFAGLTNEGVARLHSANVRQEPDGSYRVAVEFVSDDVPRTGDEREEILARKRLMEERMQHAFLTLYTSGLDVNNAIISAQFRASVRDYHQLGDTSEGYRVVYSTWMTREKAAGVKWQDPSLDLRGLWEAPLVNTYYR